MKGYLMASDLIFQLICSFQFVEAIESLGWSLGIASVAAGFTKHSHVMSYDCDELRRCENRSSILNGANNMCMGI